MPAVTESVVEEAVLNWFRQVGYGVLGGGDTLSETGSGLRADHGQVVLAPALLSALQHLNPTLPPSAIDEALRKLTQAGAPALIQANHAAHRMLVDGVNVEYQRADGTMGGAQVRVLDFDAPNNNDWLVVNQFTVIENRHNRRPDVVVFVNGLPLGVVELKNAADEKADIWQAFGQLQTYKQETPSLFVYNEALVISDGIFARVGSLSADRERFAPWRTITGETLAPNFRLELEVLVRGVFEPRRFLDLIRYFVVFEDEGGGKLTKKIAGYHQFHAVNVAVEETLRAANLARSEREIRERQGTYAARPSQEGEPGDHRIGVVWHTQGSGKSLTMAFYAGRVILHPAMGNPTLVVLTDRIDLDNQLFGVFARCQELLRQPPEQADSRSDLREKLQVRAGGVIFTTIHKFFPEEKGDRYPLLSDRSNIIVIADEAHRSQYDFVDGYARHMRDALPNASFVGFTGTPVELTDKNTRAVFGDYISIYDIQRAVQDGATVPIYYESRLARLELKESERPRLDADFNDITELEEAEQRDQLRSKWTQLEVIVGSEKRLKIIAQDLVAHFEQRDQALKGKALVVCMSRRICVALYDEIVALRPAWQNADDDKGPLKVVMTGKASETDWQMHIRSKARRGDLAKRFKDPADPLKIVIVRDMWLTGFDAPCLHTMYVDKPMQGHGLMQAIARVNRVFGEKTGGLVVDYLGLADALRDALAIYAQSGGTGQAVLDQEEALNALRAKYEVCKGLFYGFDWSKWITGKPAERLGLLPAAVDHIVKQRDGKERLLGEVRALSQAFALAVPHEDALALRDDVGFFQAVRAVVAKLDTAEGEGGRSRADLDLAIRQIVSGAIVSDQVIDIFTAAGLPKPEISILSDEFLAEVEHMPQRNLAIELLRKLLNDEIRRRGRKNVVQARSFATMLDEAIRRYQNRALETAQIIEELIALAKDMRAADARNEALGLTEDEVAFYDALEVSDSAVKVLGDDTLRTIARELVKAVKSNVSIDWTVRENVRAQMRVIVKRILRKYGYPPDKQEKATATVLEQAEVMAGEWAEAE
jgi:type I restriction enzyme, R subunit